MTIMRVSLNAASVGQAEMDADHVEMERLWSLAVDAPAFTLSGEIGRLLNHLEEHFGDEEALMVDTGFPGLTGHAADHTSLMQMLRAIAEMADDDAEAARTQLAEDLPNALNRHLEGFDQPAARWIHDTVQKRPEPLVIG
ncbi:MAG: hemerythrin family protein [Alphaproteobacteria bacterium]|nr:hemerythrin family protein [Alphaproteobacteria bacterium]